jgi:putative Mg2+ transporter-C (MgtC) family protein
MANWLTEDIYRLLVSLIIGAVIGAEREYRSKSAGLRTMILVSLGSCAFTILSIRIGDPGNPDRIAANIITGIGFLGAGVIFKEDNRVTGITTATTIWMVAALGMAAGSGHYLTALVGSVAVMVVLILLIYLQNIIERFNQLRNYKIVCEYQEETLQKYEALFKAHHLRAIRGKQSKVEKKITGYWMVQGSVKDHEQLVNQLLNDADILELDF